MSNRAFGVEIECYTPDLSEVECNCGRLDCPDGIYCEGYEANPYTYTEDIFAQNGMDNWGEVTDDGSLEYNGVEIRTPILQGAQGFKELKRAFEILNANGYTVNADCGMHVHHNAPEFKKDPEMTIRLLESWADNQKLINNMVASWRIDNDYCYEVTHDAVEDIAEFIRERGYFDAWDRIALSVNSLDYHGTIEIRQHEGTLNYEEAESWIKFGQSFLDSIAGRKRKLAEMSDEELLLKRLKVTKNASRFLATKARHRKQGRI